MALASELAMPLGGWSESWRVRVVRAVLVGGQVTPAALYLPARTGALRKASASSSLRLPSRTGTLRKALATPKIREA
jgi:hypothetical protein